MSNHSSPLIAPCDRTFLDTHPSVFDTASRHLPNFPYPDLWTASSKAVSTLAVSRGMGVTSSGTKNSRRRRQQSEPVRSCSTVLLYLEDLFRRLVKTIARAVFCHEVVVANMGKHGCGGKGGMNHDTHALFEAHGLIGSNQRALDQIVSLRVGVDSRLRRHTLQLHEFVMRESNLTARGPRPELSHRALL